MRRINLTIVFGLILLCVLQGQAFSTDVSGTLSSNTTWGPGGNPYVVVGNVVVPAGITLTIEPGVTVEFTSGKKLTVTSGRISAEGTTGNPIIFTSNGDQTPAYWAAIEISNSNNSKIKNCIVKYATEGFYLVNANLTIESSLIAENTTGIRPTSSSRLYLIDCDVCTNEGRGVFSQSADVTAIGSRFFDNNIGVAMYTSGTSYISGSIFDNNSSYQIYLVGATSHKIYSNTIEAGGIADGIYLGAVSEIKWNKINVGGYGIDVREPSAVIEENDIVGGGSGIWVNAGSTLIKGNRVRYSGGRSDRGAIIFTTNTVIDAGLSKALDNYIYDSIDGIRSTGEKITIMGNTFTNCTRGIANTSKEHIIRFNNFIGNTQAVGAGTTYPLYLEYNYFGAPNGPGGSHGAGGDGDDIDSNNVVFMPYLTATAEDFAPAGISAIRLYSDKFYTDEILPSEKLGYSQNIYISAEGDVGSSETINWVEALVTSDADATGIIVELAETGKNTGIYYGQARTAPSNDFLDSIAVSNKDEKVYVSAIGTGKSATIGDIATWEETENPQMIKSLVFIPDWAKLRIEPGTTVEAGAGVQIFVDGALEAIGQSEKKIVFKPINPNLNIGTNRIGGSLGVIYFRGGTYTNSGPRNSVMKNCIVSDAYLGVNIERTSRLEDVGPEIKNCVFENNLHGLLVQYSNPRIIGNLFDANVGDGSLSYGLRINGELNFNNGSNSPLVAVNTFTGHTAYVSSIWVSGGPARIRYNNFKSGNSYLSYAIKNDDSSKLVDAAYNYFEPLSGEISGPVLISPTLEAEVSSTEAGSAASIILMKDRAFSSPLQSGDKLGVLDPIYISAEGDSGDAARLNCMQVLISSDASSSGIVGYLIETSPSSGIYHGDAMVTSNLKRDSFGYIKADPSTDKVYVSSYVSPEVSDTVGTGSVATWETGESPIRLINGNTDYFTIPSVSTLYVEPGVTVEAANQNLLHVLGTLMASGEGNKRIRFTSAFPSKAAGDWTGISFQAAPSGSRVENSIIKYAMHGIRNNISSPLIENCIISSNTYGVFIGNNSHPSVKSNIFDQNTNGIFVDPLFSGAVYQCAPKIYGNIISNNIGYGIISKKYSGGGVDRGSAPDIQGNTIKNNTLAGIRIEYPNPRIHYNNFSGNGTAISYTSNKVIDASNNNLTGTFAHIISDTSIAGQPVTFEAAPSINSVSIKKDRAYSTDAVSMGPLSVLYIEASGEAGNSGFINYTEAKVTSESSSSGITVLLFETGPDTGKYRGSARIVPEAPVVGETSAFRDNYDEIIAVDADNIYVSILSDPAKGDIINVTKLTSFESSDNPHRFESNYVSYLYREYKLPSTYNLNIKPGVTVESGFNDRLLIQGKLLATGEADDRIVFTSSDPTSKSVGDWRGINFYTVDANNSLIRYSDVKYAEIGIQVSSSNPKIYVNDLRQNLVGIYCLGSGIVPRIADNLVRDNQEADIQCDGALGADFKINYNNIYNVSLGEYGVKRTGSTVPIDAKLNYWGGANGPYHSSNISGNPLSKVTDFVSFDAYSTVPIVQIGPVIKNPSPAEDEATKETQALIDVELFDPEEVDPAGIKVKIITGETTTYNYGDPHLSYDTNTTILSFDPTASSSVEFPEGPVTMEVYNAWDRIGSKMVPQSFYFIVDITSPEVLIASGNPDPVKAGEVAISVNFFDLIDRMDNEVSAEVKIRHSLPGEISVYKTSYSGLSWEGEATVPEVVGQGIATIEVSGAADRAGNKILPSLEAGTIFIDTVTPTVTLESPNGGETLSSQGIYIITFEAATDKEPSGGVGPNPISLYYSENNGLDYILITAEAPNSGEYPWEVPPMINSPWCRIKIEAEDLAGNIGEDQSDGAFTITAGFPYVESTSPTNGASYVSLEADIIVNFNEPVVTSSAKAAFSTEPNLAGTFSFAGGGATMIFDPTNPFTQNTIYSVRVVESVVDLDGNRMKDPEFFTFSTGILTHDATAPYIVNVSFNSKGYLPDDVVGPTPLIEADIIDPPGGWGVTKEGIDISFGPYKVRGVQYYDGLRMRHQVTNFPLGPGTYSFTIEAVDRGGNAAEPFRGRVKVFYGDVQMIGPTLVYPTPFRPLSGDRATIAYNLSVDADITIYMYDIAGRAVYTRKFRAGQEGGRVGYNGIEWNGFTDFGSYVGNGIYVYRIVSGSRVIGTGKLIVYD